MKRALGLLIVLLTIGCSHIQPEPKTKEILITFESNQPLIVVVETDPCKGNYGFCKWQGNQDDLDSFYIPAF